MNSFRFVIKYCSAPVRPRFALSANSTLTELGLQGNAIRLEGAEALAAGLQENRGLTCAREGAV